MYKMTYFYSFETINLTVELVLTFLYASGFLNDSILLTSFSNL